MRMKMKTRRWRMRSSCSRDVALFSTSVSMRALSIAIPNANQHWFVSVPYEVFVVVGATVGSVVEKRLKLSFDPCG